VTGTTSPLRIAALVKQVPAAESFRLGPAGRLVREGVDFEMNAYCRRAVSEGVLLARATGGSCTVVTLGPPSAEDVLREAVAWGADDALHLCDDAFAGSDTLATARALAAALRQAGPFDLVLFGRNSIDGETGQVPPMVAELLDLPFATAARAVELKDGALHLELELDDGRQEVAVALPAVVSVAERLCEPCKVDVEGRAAVPPERIHRVTAAALGPGPWGQAGSPTRVGATRTMTHHRAALVLNGPLDAQAARAVHELAQRGALRPDPDPDPDADADAGAGNGAAVVDAGPAERDGRTSRAGSDRGPGDGPVVAVLAEQGRPEVTAELTAAAAGLAHALGGTVQVLSTAPVPAAAALASAGADLVVALEGAATAEDVAAGVAAHVRDTRPWALLAPSTAFGREVAGRAAAATGSGLTGDAVGLSVHDGKLVAAKPAFAGALVADITCDSPTQMVTVRPGVLPAPVAAGAAHVRPPAGDIPRVVTQLTRRDRVRVLNERRDDDVETLARAEAVIGVGTGVAPDEYALLSPLAALLGAELAATRKVTDKGWAPRARQVGLTGRAIAPRLYVALGLSGKFNHMIGVRGAGTILAVNADRDAPVFGHCDVGIVGDWHEVVPLLCDALRRQAAGATAGAPLS
jgi:electron transfer flavoprotein alpha subunit